MTFQFGYSMSPMFLNPDKPLYTCKAETCEGCELAEKLICYFNIRQLLVFLLIASPFLMVAGYIICNTSVPLFISWILFMIAFFGFIEIRVMCSHCPHYAEPEIGSLKCWANYGSPKLWKYRPGPLPVMEKFVFYSGICVIMGMPFIFIILQKRYLLLIIYTVLIILWKIRLKILYCNHCINFACPFNNVDAEVKNQFFIKNPSVRKAWRK